MRSKKEVQEQLDRLNKGMEILKKDLDYATENKFPKQELRKLIYQIDKCDIAICWLEWVLDGGVICENWKGEE